jgi:DNA-binding GntR family transcriptional regulator
MTAPDLTPAQRSRSLAEQAYRTIREGIATGKFKPGQRVTERDLAARLDVSPTPVREALRRLEQESLIERVSIRTLRVVDHSPETLRELMLTGAALRALEARFATEKISDAALDRMEALVDRLGDERDDSTEQLRIAREFDAEIEQAADNRTLRNLVQTLAIIGTERRTRSVETMRQQPDLARRRLQGHRAILVALRSRDPDLVEEVFRRHATAGVDLVLGELD